MNEKGFVASSLLYGLLVIFLVVMLSTVAVLANKKLSSDKLKETAIDDLSSDYDSEDLLYSLYDSYYAPYNSNGKILWKDVVTGSEASLTGFTTSKEYSKGISFNLNNSLVLSNISLNNIVSSDKSFSFSTYIKLDNPSCTSNTCQFFKIGDITANIVMDSSNTGGYMFELCYPKTNIKNNEPTISCAEVPLSKFYNGDDTPVTLTVIFQSGAVRTFIDNEQVDNMKGLNVAGGELNTSNTSPLTIGNGFMGTMYNFAIYNGILSDSGVEKNIIQNKRRYNVE